MKNYTKKRKREDDKQSTCLVKPEEVIEFEKRIYNKSFVCRGKEEIPQLLNYLKLNAFLKTLCVDLMGGDIINGMGPDEVNEAVSFFADNNTLTSLIIASPLDGNIIDQGLSALALNKSLTSLEIKSQNVGLKGLQSLLQNNVLKKLKLTLFDYKQKDFDQIFAIVSENSTLTEFSFDPYKPSCLFYGKTKIASNIFSNFLNNRNLNTLTVHQYADDECLRILSSHPTLTTLNLPDGQITAKGVAFLLNNKTLKSVTLKSHPLGDEGACLLSTHPTITSLGLSNCGIGDQGATALAGNSCLTHLDLGLNKIGFWGVVALAFNQTLKQLTLLKVVYEPDTISDLGWIFFIGNQALQELEYVGPKMGSEIVTYAKYNLGKRNSQLQNQYDTEVKSHLTGFLPSVLASVIQGYCRGEYPYRYNLFYPQLDPVHQNQIQQALPRIIEHFSDIEKGCKRW